MKVSADKADLTEPRERYHRCIVTQKKFNPDEFIAEVTVKRDTLTVFKELVIILVVWFNRSSFFAQTIVLASAKLIAIDLSYILYSFISNFLWNLLNLDLFILGCFYAKNAQEKRRCFWTAEYSLLVYFFLHLLLVIN